MATTGWSNDDCIFDKGLPRPRHLISRTIGLQQSLRFAQWTPQSCQHSASSNRPTSIERIQRRRLSCEHECQHVVAPVSVHSLLGKAAKEWICKSFIPGYRVLEPPVRAVNLGHHLPRMTPPCVIHWGLPNGTHAIRARVLDGSLRVVCTRAHALVLSRRRAASGLGRQPPAPPAGPPCSACQR